VFKKDKKYVVDYFHYKVTNCD